MVAAGIYNEREGKVISYLYGAVTTGHIWKFMRLKGKTVYIDIQGHYINSPERILGILNDMVKNS